MPDKIKTTEKAHGSGIGISPDLKRPQQQSGIQFCHMSNFSILGLLIFWQILMALSIKPAEIETVSASVTRAPIACNQSSQAKFSNHSNQKIRSNPQ
jgi:hypothetical protein